MSTSLKRTCSSRDGVRHGRREAEGLQGGDQLPRHTESDCLRVTFVPHGSAPLQG
ncbi:hypothetical protein GW17_00020957 [Ensete ventricosum]|nr:hypothetical protein GW17_00020957 [Ensete ventricosum]